MGKIKYPSELRLKIVLEYLEAALGYKALSEKYNIASAGDIKKWVARHKYKLAALLNIAKMPRST